MPWWSAQLAKQVKLKHEAWKGYRRTKLVSDYQKYASPRNRTTQCIRDARGRYEDNIVCNVKQEPKRLFKYIRSQQKVKPVVGPLENEAGDLTQDEQDTAEILNKYFQSVFIEEETEVMPELPNRVETDCLEEILITPAEAHTELTRQDKNKAAGPDGIPTNTAEEMC